MLLSIGRAVSFVTLAMLVVLPSGCSPDDPVGAKFPPNVTTNPYPWSKTTTGTYGAFYIQASTTAGGSTTYLSGGKIFSDSGMTTGVNGGTMTAGGITVGYSSDYGYISASQPDFGQTSTWGLSGDPTNGTPSFIDSLYVPALISLSSPLTGGTLSKSSGFGMTWNSDPNNDSVVVGFKYEATLSNYADTSLSDDTYSWYRLVPDNGSYTVPSEALSSVPVGGYIEVIVARGASKVVGTTRTYHIYGMTLSDGLFKVAI